MHQNHLVSLLSVTSLLGLAACGGSSSGIGSGLFGITSCGLGCSGPVGGPISCATTEVFVNQEFSVEFTQPINPASVNSTTFRIVDSITGQVPIGQFVVDAQNPRRVRFRPTLTFDNNGNPLFGLTQGASYQITIPGQNSGAQGPFIQNTGGGVNQTQLECFVAATLGVNDPVPGAPSVTATLKVLGDQGQILDQFPLSGASEVPTDSQISLLFNDVMNPATLVNPATGQANFITVRLDLDSDPSTLTDQLPIAGEFGISIDETLGTTTVVFAPSGGFPTAGPDPGAPRLVVLDLPPTVVDLGGNGITNAGNFSFATVVADSVQIELAEDFTEINQVDQNRTGLRFDPEGQGVKNILDATGATVDTELVTGRLLRGLGGGSGRLGSLVLDTSEELVLATGPDVPTVFGPGLTPGPVDEDGNSTTDPEDIVAYNVPTAVIDNYTLDGFEPGESTITVSDGLFEFDELIIGPGAKLGFVGDNPPRLFVRGRAEVVGFIDVTPTALGEHLSQEGFGQDGAQAALGGASGGDGGDRPDSPAALIGTPTDFYFGFNHAPTAVLDLAGAGGAGRGNLPPVPGDDRGAGGGGVSWPTVFPGPTLEDPGNGQFLNLFFCGSRQQGAPGAGGSFATQGGTPFYRPFAAGAAIVEPPLPTGGLSLLLASSANLDPDSGGALLGGSGGGGGGNGIVTTALRQVTALSPCLDEIEIYIDHSGAGGGGGGGALQIQAGSSIRVAGSLVARGGDGGEGAFSPSFSSSATPQIYPDAWAAPGGGGSGGAVLIQSIDVDIAAIPGAIDVRGGLGGVMDPIVAGPPINSQTRGGDGGAGIVQIFNSPLVPLDLEVEFNKVRAFNTPPAVDPDPSDILRVGDWSFVSSGPGAVSGYQSCWRQVEGSFFNVDFAIDDFTAPDPADWVYGWNMQVQLRQPYGVVDYRGDSGLVSLQFGGLDLENLLLNDLGSSAIVVRFQGARSLEPLSSPCSTEVDSEELLPGSVTPWLESPAELNTYWDLALPENPTLASQRKPNILRYVVLIDVSQPFGSFFEGISSFDITALAD